MLTASELWLLEDMAGMGRASRVRSELESRVGLESKTVLALHRLWCAVGQVASRRNSVRNSVTIKNHTGNWACVNLAGCLDYAPPALCGPHQLFSLSGDKFLWDGSVFGLVCNLWLLS